MICMLYMSTYSYDLKKSAVFFANKFKMLLCFFLRIELEIQKGCESMVSIECFKLSHLPSSI